MGKKEKQKKTNKAANGDFADLFVLTEPERTYMSAL